MQVEPEKKRVRLGCMVKPENLEAVKEIKQITDARSEGIVIDQAIERLAQHVKRRAGK